MQKEKVMQQLNEMKQIQEKLLDFIEKEGNDED